MHHMQKIWIGTGTVAAAILGLSLLTTPAYADETIETIPPVATATTQSEQLTTGWVHQATSFFAGNILNWIDGLPVRVYRIVI